MKKILLALTMVLAFNLSNAQETFQYKKYGQNIIWEFGEDTLTVTTNGEVNTQPIKVVGKTDKLYVYHTTEAYMGVNAKYSFVKKGKKGEKYTMIYNSVDDFTGEVSEYYLSVKKISR